MKIPTALSLIAILLILFFTGCQSDPNSPDENNLLSDQALVNTKPQLEIFADDVKCSHGATIGQMDDDAKFYLKSRGIGEEASKGILLHAFASDVVASIKNESIRNYIEKIITEKFNK